jgi:hypothetical protein
MQNLHSCNIALLNAVFVVCLRLTLVLTWNNRQAVPSSNSTPLHAEIAALVPTHSRQ